MGAEEESASSGSLWGSSTDTNTWGSSSSLTEASVSSSAAYDLPTTHPDSDSKMGLGAQKEYLSVEAGRLSHADKRALTHHDVAMHSLGLISGNRVRSIPCCLHDAHEVEDDVSASQAKPQGHAGGGEASTVGHIEGLGRGEMGEGGCALSEGEERSWYAGGSRKRGSRARRRETREALSDREEEVSGKSREVGQQREFDKRRLEGMDRVLMAVLKGFTIGAGLKGGLSIFSLVARLAKQSAAGRGMGSSSKASPRPVIPLGWAPVLAEALRYGLFVGSFAGAYCSLDEGISRIWGHHRTAKWRSFLAGATAGPALLLVGSPSSRASARAVPGAPKSPAPRPGHTSLALYVFLRAAVLAVRCGVKSPRWGWLLKPFTFQHGDVLLMCLSSTQILTAWLLEPSSLPPSYVSFLNKHGGKPLGVVQGVGELACAGGGQLAPQTAARIVQAWQGAGTVANKRLQAAFSASLPSLHSSASATSAAAGEAGSASLAASMASVFCHSRSPCPFLHPGQTCVPHFLDFFQHAYARAVLVYIPVYLIPALVVHRAAWLNQPLSILLRTTRGIARSSLFLATYCSSAWLWTCGLHQLLGTCSPATLAVGTAPAGLAVLLEKKSRRMELALYCFSRAIESFFICCHKWGWLRMLHPRTNSISSSSSSSVNSDAVWSKVSRALPSSTQALDVLILGSAASIIMHCYANERDVFKSKYLNVLDWVFGAPSQEQDLRQEEVNDLSPCSRQKEQNLACNPDQQAPSKQHSIASQLPIG